MSFPKRVLTILTLSVTILFFLSIQATATNVKKGKGTTLPSKETKKAATNLKSEKEKEAVLPSQKSRSSDTSVKYKKGKGITISSGKNKISISSRVQVRYKFTSKESANSHGFEIRRVKLKFKGSLHDPSLKFGLQIAFGTSSGNKTATVTTPSSKTAKVITSTSKTGFAVLDDAYLDWSPSHYFGIKAGQFKIPFLKQQILSSAKQQFIDRSSEIHPFNFVRDIGVDLHGKILKEKLYYNFFVVNGEGVNSLNKNLSLLLGARFEVPILGRYSNSESDLKNSQNANWGIGLALAYNKSPKVLKKSTIPALTQTSYATFDTSFLYKSFSFSGAFFLARTLDENPFTNIGYNVQTGYFVLPQKIEIAFRNSAFMLKNKERNQFEYAIALNYFIQKYNIKIQVDYTLFLDDPTKNLTSQRFRLQTQFVF